MREGVVEPALVRDEHRHGHLVRDGGPLEHLGAVGQLRDHVRSHEAGHLEPAKPCAREHLHEAHLVVGRDDLRLVLEAVAGADLADQDGLAGWRFGHP